MIKHNRGEDTEGNIQVVLKPIHISQNSISPGINSTCNMLIRLSKIIPRTIHFIQASVSHHSGKINILGCCNHFTSNYISSLHNIIEVTKKTPRNLLLTANNFNIFPKILLLLRVLRE